MSEHLEEPPDNFALKGQTDSQKPAQQSRTAKAFLQCLVLLYCFRLSHPVWDCVWEVWEYKER